MSAIQKQMAEPACAADDPVPAFQGNAQAFQSPSSTPILILAALIAVYIILGMLYENTIHPLTIISTLPSAGARRTGHATAGFGFGLDVMGIWRSSC